MRFFHLLLLVFSLLSSCQGPPLKGEKTLKINLRDEPQTLDPRMARDPSDLTLMRMFFEGLTRIGPDDKPQLALASQLEISEDLKTYRFALRDALWSNKEPVTASNFVYSWCKTLSPGSQSCNAFLLYLIKNGRKVRGGELPVEELGVRAEDQRTLVVELEVPTPYFLELLATPVFFPVEEGWDKAHPNWAEKVENYVSNGPFLLKEWLHHDQIVAVKNPTYWDKKVVGLEEIQLVMVPSDTELTLFEKGQLHWAGSPISTLPLDSLKGLKEAGKIHPLPIAETAFIRANTEDPLLSHPKLRKSLALAVDRKALVEHVTQGGQIPVTSLVPPSMMGKSEGYFKDADIETAVQLLDEALKELGITRKELSKLTFCYAASERSHLIAQTIQEDWNRAFGFQVQLEGIERRVYFDRLSKQDYQLAFCSWRADYHDPLSFLEVFKHKKRCSNNTLWEEPKYAELLDASHLEADSDQRLQLLRSSEGILMEAMPIFPLFEYTMLYLKDRRLSGVFLSSMGNLDFKWAVLQNSD